MRAFRACSVRIRRKWRKLKNRIVREKASPEYIARGWAIGMFYGCAMPFGTQLMVSIPTAILLRGSKMGATLGTLITNHLTIFFIYPLQTMAGTSLLGHRVTYHQINHALAEVVREQSFASLRTLSGHLIAGFFLGGILLALALTPLTYCFVLDWVHRYRALREKFRQTETPDSSGGGVPRG